MIHNPVIGVPDAALEPLDLVIDPVPELEFDSEESFTSYLGEESLDYYL